MLYTLLLHDIFGGTEDQLALRSVRENIWWNFKVLYFNTYVAKSSLPKPDGLLSKVHSSF